MPEALTAAQARQIALAAQGFLRHRPIKPSRRTVWQALDRTGVLQVDSVNVLQRAQFMPLFSRVGAYDTGLLIHAAQTRRRRLIEYWAHVQALMPVGLWPLMQHRMAWFRQVRHKWWKSLDDDLAGRLLAEITARGPSTVRDFANPTRQTSARWVWKGPGTRTALDYLYMVGDLAIAGRGSQFEAVYDLPERVLPAHVLALPTPPQALAELELVRRAAASHGVATVRCLADYYRMRQGPVKAAVDSLIEDGDLAPVRIEGWSRPAYLHRGARQVHAINARALLSPFDPVVWLRERTQRLFDFHYRIEIYTPSHKRVHGYYVLPFLLGDEIVARVDLKSDRRERTLVVKSAWAERCAPAETPDELADELRTLAAWLALEAVRVELKGDLASALASALADRPHPV
jgi:uncharacterized protein